jgi:hypothetical protein
MSDKPNTLQRVLAVSLAAVVVVFFVFLFRSGKPDAPESAPTASAQPVRTAPTASAEIEVFGARHMLIQYAGSQRAPVDLKRTKEEAKRRADEAATKAAKLVTEHKDLEARAKAFGELVKEYSDEPGAAERGGDLGRFRPGGIDPAFGAAVAKMKKGDVSGAVETPFGFHVILRTY